jgi:hypothetical protein
MSSSLSSMLSRAPTMPNYLWSENIPLALGPGEARQFQLETEKELAAGNTVSITMSNTDQQAAIAKLLSVNGTVQVLPSAASANQSAPSGSAAGSGVEPR